MDDFKYNPIDLGRSAIRLLRLIQGSHDDDGDDDDVVVCEIFQAWIDEPGTFMPYEALPTRLYQLENLG
jgi:hypothetical protein